MFGASSDYDKGRAAGAAFLASSGLEKAPKVLLNGIPLDEDGLSADRFEETVITAVQKATPKIQKAIMDGQLTDDIRVGEWALDQPEVMPRLNARILGKHSDALERFLDLTDVMEHDAPTLHHFLALPEPAQNAHLMQRMRYLARSGINAGRTE